MNEDDLLKESLVMITQLERELERSQEPIAIIGMGCRYAGGANSPDELWKMLIEKRDGISEIPPSRWDNKLYYDSHPGIPGKIITNFGGFLNTDIENFDAHFFNILPEEAEYVDPQQRLLLEVVWEAIEQSGRAPASLSGTTTGVFVGIVTTDFFTLISKKEIEESRRTYLTTGSTHSIAAGRISYVLNLKGPSISMDCACASSLVAIDEACNSLHLGDCNLAIAGGVTLNLSPDPMITFSNMGALSPSGKCKTFDISADGYGRAEGCGIVILKRLSDAIKDNDTILAIVRGSDSNHSGARGSLIHPSGESQEALIRDVVAKAQIKPDSVDFVEVHGSATPMGDALEVKALGAIYGQRDDANPLILGAIKTNIGYTEGASGVAGVIKIILALQNELIPANLNFTTLHPGITKDFPFEVITEPKSWKKGEKIRRAGVNAFGMNGTNAHIIIEEAPTIAPTQQPEERPYHLLTLSAKSEQALEQLIVLFQNYLANTKENIADIVYTANAGRNHFEYRLAVTGKNIEELKEHLLKHTISKAPLNKRTKIIFQHTQESIKHPEKNEIIKIDISPKTDWESLFSELSKDYIKGINIDWSSLDSPYKRKKVILPTYPFQRKRYWPAKLGE